MKNFKQITVILFLLMFFYPSGVLIKGAVAESTACQEFVISLQAAIEIALEKNPLLEAAHYRVKASAERITQAKSGFYPKIYISEAYQLTTNPMWAFGMKLNQGIITQQDFDPDSLNDPSSIDNFNTMLWMTWPVFDSGQTWYGRQQAELSHQASAAGLDRSSQEIISQTVSAYTDLVFAKESVAVVDQALQTAEAQHRLIKDRYKSGLTVKSDLLRVRVHVSELEQKRFDVNSRFLIAQSALNAVMGMEMSDDVLPSTPLLKNIIPEKALKEWIAEALTNRPDFKKIKFHEQSARTEIKKSRSAHWPSVNVNGSYEMNTADFDERANNYTVGANVTLNLFSGHGISAREREALYRHNEINANLRAMNQSIQLETREAYYKLQSAEKRIQAAELSVDEAMEALKIVSNRYENGQLSIVSLLDAELTLTRAKNNLNMALKDHIQYRVQLALAVGDLDETFQ